MTALIIEEGWGQKPRQRSSRLLGGRTCSISCRASCFAAVDLEETVEFMLFFQIDRGKIVSAARKWTNFAPPPNRHLCLCFSLHPSSMADWVTLTVKYYTVVLIILHSESRRIQSVYELEFPIDAICANAICKCSRLTTPNGTTVYTKIKRPLKKNCAFRLVKKSQMCSLYLYFPAYCTCQR